MNFKWVNGFAGIYKFDGTNFVSASRYIKRKVGKHWRTERVLKKHMLNGYLIYNVEVCGTNKILSEHRLVWEYHFGKIKSGLQINHKNGIKTDNRLENLELVTPKQNILHSCDVLGKHRKGENNGRSKITETKVLEIIKIGKQKTLTYKKIGDSFGISAANVGKICRREIWRHI